MVQWKSQKFRFLWKLRLNICFFWLFDASVRNQFMSANNTFFHVGFWFSAYSLNLYVCVFFLRIMTTTAAAEKRLKFVHKKQTNPLVQLNLMPFISFITMLFCCASLWSSSSLVHQVKFYWHHIERIGVDTQIGPDQAVSVKINFMM